jgi:hypothetical protein
MDIPLCIGIVARNDMLEIAALEHGRLTATAAFPDTRMGREALGGFLAGRGQAIRLAVAGVAAMGIALALGNAPGREAYIVSPAVADQAATLARFAAHAI